MSGDVHEVWRGKEILSMDSRIVDFGGFIPTSDGAYGSEQFINLIHGLQLHSKYSQSDCVNSFHADKKIRLKGCGFFGPFPQKTVGQEGPTEYTVTIRLDMLWMDNRNELRTRTVSEIFKKVFIDMTQVNNVTVFSVDFDSPVQLDPNAFKYNLVFRLEGPPTYELDPTKLQTNVSTRGINFFFWPGSKQMPVLRFCNLDES